MSDRSIEQLLTAIAGHERIMGTELDAIHPHVRPSFEMAIREAKEGLVRDREDYKTRVFSQALAFFLSGDREKVETFVELAQKLGNVFVVDGSAMYAKLADRIEPTIGASREFSVNQLTELVMGLRDIALAAGIRGDLQAPRLADLRTIHTRAELVSYVRELVTTSAGESLNAIFVQQELMNQALARKFTGHVLAAVVVNATPESQPTLSQPFSTKTEVAIGTEDEVDEAFVLKIFKQGKESRPAPQGRRQR